MVGWINELFYKDFSLSFTLDWRQGGEIISRTQALAGVSGQLIETESRPENGIIAEGVTPAGEPNTIAVSAEAYYRSFYDRNHEENNTLDASFVKLREMRLGYTFPKKSQLHGLRIALIGKNLFVYAPEIKHFDPEQIAFQGQGFVSGVEDMSYPSTRSFGVSLGFDF
jgi:hypothetical protein